MRMHAQKTTNQGGGEGLRALNHFSRRVAQRSAVAAQRLFEGEKRTTYTIPGGTREKRGGGVVVVWGPNCRPGMAWPW